MRVWKEKGYVVPTGLLERIVDVANNKSNDISIDLPRGKEAYIPELEYLKKALLAEGLSSNGDGESLHLSAFNEVPARRRAINRDGWLQKINPLWGSLIGIAYKSNLMTLLSGDKVSLPRFLPKSYMKDELELLDPNTPLIAKPLTGTGSSGIRNVTAQQGLFLPAGYLYQERVAPLIDTFGVCLELDGAPLKTIHGLAV